MTATAKLAQAGVDVKLLEASGQLGGRLKRASGFAEFPIDLGAEWIHEDPEVLGDIIGQGWTRTDVETIVYQPQTYQVWNGEELKDRNLLRHAYAEQKFYRTTWFGFFERFVLPDLLGSYALNSPVQSIEHSASGVTVRTVSGQTFEADRVIVTTPISILKRGDISISPAPEDWRIEALQDVSFGQGLKVFLKFGERFFPDMLIPDGMSSFLSDAWDSKLYYDAGFGKDSDDNVLALFNVAEGRLPLAERPDDEIVRRVLSELNEMFDGVPQRTFEDAIVQNWSRERYISGSYSMTNNSDEYISDILAPIEGRVFFAGEALGGEYQSTVHGAAYSAIEAVEQILG